MIAQSELKAVPPIADDPLSSRMGSIGIVYLKESREYLWGPLMGRPEGFVYDPQLSRTDDPVILEIEGELRLFNLAQFGILPLHKEYLGKISDITDQAIAEARAFVADQLEEVLTDPRRPAFAWATEPEALIEEFRSGGTLPASPSLEIIIATRLDSGEFGKRDEMRFGADSLQTAYLVSLFFGQPPTWPASVYSEAREAERAYEAATSRYFALRLGASLGASTVTEQKLRDAEAAKEAATQRMRAARAAIDY